MDDTQTTRRQFLKAVGAGAASIALAGPMGCEDNSATGLISKAAKEKLNIVFVIIDDLGWTDVGCYGNKFHETPNIDRLAKEGMRFTNAYAAAPVCSPTRASIMSGQYPARVGITDWIMGHWRPWAKLVVPINRQQHLPLETVTVAEALKPAGYVSGIFGKWHLSWPHELKYYPDKQGFDSTLVYEGGKNPEHPTHFEFKTWPQLDLTKDDYLAEVLTDKSEEFMQANKDRPFFLCLSHFAVHIKLEARKELIEKYKKKPKPPTGVNNPIYAAMVEHVDDSLGRIVKKLDELNIAERTVVIFYSDNGAVYKSYYGELISTNAPLRGDKGTLYEGGIRVPLIVRWPGVVQPGSTCDTPVSSMDFYPTFLDIAGVKPGKNQVLDGCSIVGELKQTAVLKRDAIYWHYPHYHHSKPVGAIRQGNWKLIEFFEDGKIELYNLADDIGEKNNLATKMPDKALALQKKLAKWRKSVGAAMPTVNPDYDPAREQQWGLHPSLKTMPQ